MSVRQSIIICGLACALSHGAAPVAHATSFDEVVVDTALWSIFEGPSSGAAPNGLTSSGGNGAIQNNNSDATIVSDFVLTGDFTFDATVRPIRTGSYNDNDIVGLVFGWQDPGNHYRIGFTQGGTDDGAFSGNASTGATGARGLYLVKEENNTGTILFENPNLFWNDNVDYTFVVGREGNDLSFFVRNANTSALLEEQTVTDTTFMDGRIGFYTESQQAAFSGLAGTPEPPPSAGADAGSPITLTAATAGSFDLNGQATGEGTPEAIRWVSDDPGVSNPIATIEAPTGLDVAAIGLDNTTDSVALTLEVDNTDADTATDTITVDYANDPVDLTTPSATQTAPGLFDISLPGSDDDLAVNGISSGFESVSWAVTDDDANTLDSGTVTGSATALEFGGTLSAAQLGLEDTQDSVTLTVDASDAAGASDSETLTVSYENSPVTIDGLTWSGLGANGVALSASLTDLDLSVNAGVTDFEQLTWSFAPLSGGDALLSGTFSGDLTEPTVGGTVPLDTLLAVFGDSGPADILFSVTDRERANPANGLGALTQTLQIDVPKVPVPATAGLMLIGLIVAVRNRL